MNDSQFTEALSRLDAEIAEIERKLADLKFKRSGAEAFLLYMASSTTDSPQSAESAAPASPRPPESRFYGGGPVVVNQTDIVMAEFNAHPDDILTVDQIEKLVNMHGHKLDREQVRNAIHYCSRKGLVESGGQRGFWRLKNSENPPHTGEGFPALSELSPQGGEHSNDDSGPENHRESPAGWNGDYRAGASIGT
jgi:hypothetical protein